jgi:type VI secretion system protein ImpK
MRLVDCFTDIMTYTLLLQKKGGLENVSFDQASADMERLIRESEALFDKSGLTQEDYEFSKFAVFAWVDEIIMVGSWPGRRQWQGEQLQRRYFQTSDAGEIFFQKLNTIGSHQNHVREVYYMCLALGFTGQYHNKGDDMLLDQLRTSNLKILTASSMDLPSVDHITLFPDACIVNPDAPEIHHKKGFSFFTMAAFFAPVGLFGVLFLIYRFVLSNIGETLISRIP